MQEVQKKLIEFQSSLQEKATSDDGKISAMMNGRMELKDKIIASINFRLNSLLLRLVY